MSSPDAANMHALEALQRVSARVWDEAVTAILDYALTVESHKQAGEALPAMPTNPYTTMEDQ